MRIRWRGFELPGMVHLVDQDGDSNVYGKFVAEPFERGYASTIGNALRRVLLSSLEGSAATSVKLAGVDHEFSSIPGVVEDVTEICLNLKSIVFRHSGSGVKMARLDCHQRGVITAGDLLCDDQLVVLNRDQVIATLADDVPLSFELTVQTGRGFALGTDAGTNELGTIGLDACFSPVVRVRHTVEETRVGQRTNYERLVLEIWTDGSISPRLAMTEAAKILRKHISPFVAVREPDGEGGPEGGLRGLADATGYSPVDLELEERLGMSLAELNLSVRATNCLESEGVATVRDLVSRSEDQLLQVRNFGETTLAEVRERLSCVGLRLGMKIGKGTRR